MRYTFETALVWLKRGHKIRRAGWDENHLYAYLDTDGRYRLAAIRANVVDHVAWTFWNADVLAEDWVVVDEGWEVVDED